jgi:hypothetical protein
MRNNEKNVSLDYGNACEAEVYFGAQVNLSFINIINLNFLVLLLTNNDVYFRKN